MIPYTNIWGSAAIKNRDCTPLDQTTFSVEARRVQYIADIQKLTPEGNGTEKTVDDLMNEYGTTRNEAERLIGIAQYNLEAESGQGC